MRKPTPAAIEHHRGAVRARLARANVTRPGPDSVTWKINREMVVVAGWQRAILLQFAHPLVARGVHDHSGFRAGLKASMGRLRSTVGAMLALTFGDDDAAVDAAARINAVHDHVHGQIPGPAGAFDSGHHYSAHDHDLLRWVHATLLESVILTYELLVAPLTDAEKDRYCEEAAIAEPLLNLPAGSLPRDARALESYMREMLGGGKVAVTDTSCNLARAVLFPPRSLMLWPALRPVRLITIGLLPPHIRAAYGFIWDAREERALARWTAVIRTMVRLLPPIAREWAGARRRTVGRNVNPRRRYVRFASWLPAATLVAGIGISAQERFSFYHPSTPESVERMLTLAELRDDDVVVDLGSGDGLIPLAAARMNGRLRGRGVDIDAKLVEESNERARSEGLADRVHFEHRNAFDAELREATVVTMWLFPELMRLLRPVILERARPGTRVLTSTWDLGGWPPDKVDRAEPAIYLWIVPARVAGGWDWELTLGGRRIRYGALLEQQFQTVEGVARAGDRREVLATPTLRGDELAFRLNITLDGLGLAEHEFSGKIERDQIVGTAKVTAPKGTFTVPWRASRTAQPHYFAPTGIGVFEPPPVLR